MTTAATEAPLRSARAALDRLVTRIGRGIVNYTEVLSRSDELRRLNALSDDDLARIGIRREEIVRHVFRNKILL